MVCVACLAVSNRAVGWLGGWLLVWLCLPAARAL